MKIEDDELSRLERQVYIGFDAARDIIFSLKEAQELIEKFKPSWHVYNDVLDSDEEIEAACCYCGASISDECDEECPYAIRERLGYGQKD